MGGMAYTMTDTTKLSTAECYGIALCELCLLYTSPSPRDS